MWELPVECTNPVAFAPSKTMGISNPQNLPHPPVQEPRPFGVRVSLKSNDPFGRLVGNNWHRDHWYHSAADRDAALAEMSRKHEYSRPGDKPALVFEKVENLAASRGL